MLPSSSLLIVALGVDALTRRALQADIPRAQIAVVRRVRAWRGERPDLVVINASRMHAPTERMAVWQRWDDAVVIVELIDEEPTTRVWCSPTVVHAVELGPGFLTPFLPTTERWQEGGGHFDRGGTLFAQYAAAVLTLLVLLPAVGWRSPARQTAPVASPRHVAYDPELEWEPGAPLAMQEQECGLDDRCS